MFSASVLLITIALMTSQNLSVLYCGSPEFACPTLSMLDTLDCIETLTVVSQPDQPKGRGKKQHPTPIKQLAQSLNLTVHTPSNKDEFIALTTQLKPDLIIVIAYGLILPKHITDTYYCINAHASLLPFYRGASPIQSSLLQNDTATGITLIHMNEKMDEGNIILQQSINISPNETFGSLHHTLAECTRTCIRRVIKNFAKTNFLPTYPQNHSLATYCSKLNKASFYLNPADSIQTNLAKIKAFSPTPGAYSFCKNKRVKILKAIIENNHIIPQTVQPEGKKTMAYIDFQRGSQDPIELC